MIETINSSFLKNRSYLNIWWVFWHWNPAINLHLQTAICWTCVIFNNQHITFLRVASAAVISALCLGDGFLDSKCKETLKLHGSLQNSVHHFHWRPLWLICEFVCYVFSAWDWLWVCEAWWNKNDRYLCISAICKKIKLACHCPRLTSVLHLKCSELFCYSVSKNINQETQKEVLRLTDTL